MNPRHLVNLTVALVLIFVLPLAAAAEPIAKVSGFKGKAFIYPSKDKQIVVDRIGIPLNSGDKIVVRDGEVQFAYEDGAVSRVEKFTTASVEVREEESAFLFFKRKRTVRKLICFVGKIFHKSGSSIKFHYALTPTAICAIRGSKITFNSLNQINVTGGVFVSNTGFSTVADPKQIQDSNQQFQNNDPTTQGLAGAGDVGTGGDTGGDTGGAVPGYDTGGGRHRDPFRRPGSRPIFPK